MTEEESMMADICTTQDVTAVSLFALSDVIFSIKRDSKMRKDVLERIKRRRRIVKIDHD